MEKAIREKNSDRYTGKKMKIKTSQKVKMRAQTKNEDESAQEQPSGEGNILEDWENGILSESGMQFFDGWR